MTEAPLILALDIATRTGFARGRIGEKPVSGSTRFGQESTNANVIFGAAINWLSIYLAPPYPLPDVLMIESLLPPEAMKNRTSRQVRDRLAGLHGALRGAAELRGVRDIRECSVGDVRAHFIGDRTAKRAAAKRDTMRRCEQLGWSCKDDNAADALAVWSFACAQIDPATALKTVPLFNRALVL